MVTSEGTGGFARRVAARFAFGVMTAAALVPAIANATLSVTPLTWNVIGLDSNSPATGPQNFPIGARVCSTTGASNVSVEFFWDSTNAYVNTRPGSRTTLSFASIPANGCADAYFEAQVTRDAAAYDTVRRYHITASDGVDTASTPTPRELYVEHLISQNRNSITAIKVDGVSVPAGGSVGMVVGNTYVVELDGGTATQGYNQFEAFINLSNAIFQVLSVQTTYSADNSPYVPGPAPAINDKLYADACKWENNPGSPNYRSCVGGDFKAGGSNVVTLYTIKIIAGGGTSQALSTLLYDFSGSSFHYNADFGVHGFIANIVDPSALAFTKQFSPSSTAPGGTSTLTFTISNPSAAAIGGVSFSDSLPIQGGGQMVVATPALFSTTGCGAATFAPTAGATTLNVTNATIPANGTCTVSALVSIPASPSSGSYVNTSGDLVVDALDTGRSATASLGISTTVPPTNVCGLTLARWTMATAAGTTVPPVPSSQAANVASAVAATGAALTSQIDTAIGNPVNSWSASGFPTSTTFSAASTAYFQFAVDTSNYTSITFSFDGRLDANQHGPASLQLASSTDGVTFTPYGTALAPTNAFATFGPAVSGANASGVTYFRVYGYNAFNSGNSSLLYLDNITVGGCATPQSPTLVKSFAPSTVVVGATSTLSFTLTNPNSVALTGADFADSLPSGMQVAATPATTNTCGGTWAPAAGDTSLSFAGGTIPANGSCSIDVNVTATTAGTHANVSGFLTTTESGTNPTATGSASATLQALVPPSIAAAFAPVSVQVNANAVLTFTLTNPNVAVALSAVSFADNYPANLVNANPAVPAVSNTCGGTLTASPGGTTVSLSGGSIPAAGSCTISVPVTSAIAASYTTTTGTVADGAAGSGNTASATLEVTAPQPSSSVLKQIGTSSTGPWFNFVAVAPGTSLYYRFTVENTGDVALDPFGVSDPTLTAAGIDPSSCAWQTSNVPSTLPSLPVASATIDPTATCVVGPLSATLGAHENTATAQGSFGGSTFASVGSTADYVGAVPGFSLVKEIATSPLGPWSSAIGVAAGTDVFYRFTLVNTGGLDLSGINVTDAMVDLSSCTFTDPLAVGDATTCTVGPVVAAGSTGTLVVNTATGHGTNGGTVDTPPASASYTVSSANADVAVTNSDGGTSVVAGTATTYTVTVSNNGPDDVTNAAVVDTAPAGITFGSWSCAVTSPGSGGSVVSACGLASGSGDLHTTATLQPGASVMYTIAATVAGDATGSVTTTATVAAPTGVFDAVSSNDSASDTDTVTVDVDLGISVDDGVTSVNSGSTTTYTVTVTNAGPSTSVGATLTDAAVAGLAKTGVVCGASPGQCATPPTIAELESGSFTLPAIAPGQMYQLQVAAQVTAASGSVTNGATIAAGAGSVDTNPANDSASDTDTVSVLPPPVANDLAVTIDDGVVSIAAGATTTYTITVTNNGVATITGGILTDAVVPGLVKTAVACAAVPGQCATPPTIADLDGGAFALPALAPGATYAITVTAQVTASTGTVANTATIAMPSGITDDVPANDSATDVDAIIPPSPSLADVSVTVDDGITSVTQGAAVTYTIDVQNSGPQDAFGVSVSDAFPAVLTGVSWTCVGVAGGLCPEQPANGDIAAVVNLPAGSMVVFTATATLLPVAAGSLVNSATATVPPTLTDSNLANNSATDVDTITLATVAADLGVSVDDGVTTVTSGTTTNYTVTVVNNGPSAVTGAILADPSVAGLTKSAVTCAPIPGQCVTPPTIVELESGTFALPALVSGQTYAIVVAASVTAVGGTVANGAAVAPPGGVMDSVSANDSANDTDAVLPAPLPDADLAMTVTANPGTASPGGNVTYTLTIVNNGPSGVADAIVTDTAPPGIVFGNWTCSVANAGSGGSVATACGASGGSGNVSVTVTLQPGATVTYVIAATVSSGASGSIVDGARVDVPGGMTDSVPTNNASTAPLNVQAAPPPPPQVAQPIPTLSEWALVALSLLMLGAAAVSMRRSARR
ncbi:MAG TPA: IPTL-CTERM sorting domain-containing protein [Casimicrobiaceae bacterium]|nr:IPTL-CTERM sorting domain-containing protein [Casimicrobiaceae bacterium]